MSGLESGKGVMTVKENIAHFDDLADEEIARLKKGELTADEARELATEVFKYEKAIADLKESESTTEESEVEVTVSVDNTDALRAQEIEMLRAELADINRQLQKGEMSDDDAEMEVMQRETMIYRLEDELPANRSDAAYKLAQNIHRRELSQKRNEGRPDMGETFEKPWVKKDNEVTTETPEELPEGKTYPKLEVEAKTSLSGLRQKVKDKLEAYQIAQQRDEAGRKGFRKFFKWKAKESDETKKARQEYMDARKDRDAFRA